MTEQNEKQVPYLTGYIQFADGTTARVSLWHFRPRPKKGSATAREQGNAN